MENIDYKNLVKSVRIFAKHNKLYVDYRINTAFIIDKDRIRFSTGIKDIKKNKYNLEENIEDVVLNHYLDTYNIKNPNKLYLKDIALIALNEDKDNRSEDTHEDYLNIYDNFIKPTFANTLLKDIKPRDIKKWKNDLLNEKHFSKSRFTKYYRTLNFIMKYAYMNEYISKNPMDLVDKKSKAYKTSQTSSMKYYSKEEVKKIIEYSQDWFKVFITTLFYTGMRTGECLALKWEDINFSKNTITIQRSSRHGKIRNTTKTGITNIIDMAKPVKAILLKYYDEAISDEWIFPNPKTLKPYFEPKAIINSKFKPLLEDLGIEYKTLYATRHSFASNMVESNVPLTYIQKQLGHKKLSTTMDYYIKNGFVNECKRDERIDNLFI